MTLAYDKGTTSIGLVHEALAGAIERGIDTAPALARANIDPALLLAPHARVSASAFSQLWVALADLLDDEFFAIDSHPMRRGSFRLLCQATIGCETLEQALRRALSFLRSVLDDVYGELQVDADLALLLVHDHGVQRRLFSYGTWLILVHGLLCWLGNRRIPLQGLWFRPDRPSDDSDYRMRFCEEIHFGAAGTVAIFDRSFLSLKVVQTPQALATFLKESPGTLLVKYRNDESMSSRIRQYLRGQKPDEWPERDRLAKVLGMSNSTLQRRLQLEGVSYQGVKDDLRRDIAINLLSRGDLSIIDVAFHTGFQEASAFHRAFKKWTGASPGAYRRSGA